MCRIAFRTFRILLSFFIVVATSGIAAAQSNADLRSGDLLFVPGGDNDMERAICESTGSYSHVAIAECDSAGQLWVIEAVTAPHGVRCIPFAEWIDEVHNFFVYRLSVPFDTAAMLSRAHSCVGQPYDEAFLPNNGALYCSELVYEAYLDSVGNHLFHSQPMNWRDSNGDLPEYWIEHFKKLGTPIPEGAPGTNPTDLSREPILRKIPIAEGK